MGATILGRNCSMTQIMAVTGHKSASSVAVYQRVSSKEKQVMGDIITSSVRGEQPSQLSSIMPPHSTSRLQLMPPTQNSSSSTSLVQMRANTHVSSSVTDVVDILDVTMMIYFVIITLLQQLIRHKHQNNSANSHVPRLYHYKFEHNNQQVKVC